MRKLILGTVAAVAIAAPSAQAWTLFADFQCVVKPGNGCSPATGRQLAELTPPNNGIYFKYIPNIPTLADCQNLAKTALPGAACENF